MSGSGRSGGSRASVRPGGWEEAGGEFYQESYPGADLDLDTFSKDPHYFATLLPSKQNRATTKRPRGGDLTTFKRRNSGYYNTMGNNTAPNEIHCAMMPDLSQNLATEESTWEEIMLIKSMPVNMAQKKEMKAKLLSAETFRLQGYKQFKWRRRKLWERLKVHKKEFLKKIDLWRTCIRTVSGNFGTGVATYFMFIKWLMYLNFLLALVVSLFIILPNTLLEKVDEGVCFPINDSLSIDCCRDNYFGNWTNKTDKWDLALGSGWLEHTVLFYGFYPGEVMDKGKIFDMRVCYVTVWGGTLTIILLVIIKKGLASFRTRLIESEGGSYRYCNLLFAGWDYCIYTNKGKQGRHRAIRSEVKRCFEVEDNDDEKKWGRWIGQWCAKAVAMGVVAAQGAIIWFMYEATFKVEGKGVWALLLGYLPSGAAAVAHAVIPSLVRCLAPASRLTRAAAPRLATLSALLGSFYYAVNCKPRYDSCSIPCPTCWETLFGQHVTRLISTELAMHILIAFFIDLPRSFCARRSPFCSQEFHLPYHVVHLLYFQTLVFLGSFYAPFLPALATVLYFFLFYLKKFSCLINSYPAQTVYWASHSKALYTLLLFISYLLSVLPLLYSILAVKPSKSCGPYSGKSISNVIVSAYLQLPSWFTATTYHLTTSFVAVPLITFLCLYLFYYYIVAKANKEMVLVLKKQLILEGHDKQFLLNRLSAFIKQHQERHKGPRSIHPAPHNSSSS